MACSILQTSALPLGYRAALRAGELGKKTERVQELKFRRIIGR
jgi:hypothetical protein